MGVKYVSEPTWHTSSFFCSLCPRLKTSWRQQKANTNAETNSFNSRVPRTRVFILPRAEGEERNQFPGSHHHSSGSFRRRPFQKRSGIVLSTAFVGFTTFMLTHSLASRKLAFFSYSTIGLDDQLRFHTHT